MRQYMAVFSKVPRFSTVVLFMSKKEKELAKEVWDKLGVRNGGAAWGIS
jgi:RNA polymerase II-associated protein 3